MNKWKIGIDVGGTFTDGIAIEEQTGEIRNAKVPSTSEKPAEAVMNALRELSIDPKDITGFHHGYTVGINAFLTRTGSKVGLLCTDGFKDFRK